ncbi:retinol dehydrogenase 12-like [Rhagoletis pomonella]|uniref:retinol dehydrogenase 12-like n=1 Tax=Rhagoletis pomonella TaxID=28610 RepID=UPI0017866749|nr:retinol dehydrogenase 12-like [Rhagoletis pomonella]XP_036343913.1 retinol dehydrogenase 12-like [Rhagoletis pomonella]
MAEELMLSSSSKHKSKTLCFYGAWAWIVDIFLTVFLIVFILYILRKIIQGPFYRKRNRIDEKVVIITGCSAGIGKEIALELARRGARIYMACRDAARCEATRLEIIDDTGNQQVYNRTLDLGSLESVRQFAARFVAEEQRLDILVNNADVMTTQRTLTADGFEYQFGVNHLGHFLLTNLLLERLKVAAPSRVVVMSSFMHLFGRINKDDLNSELRKTKIFGSYANSKLANILFARKLAKLLDGTSVTVNSCNPGIVRTEAMFRKQNPPWLWFIVDKLFGLVARTPLAGAQTALRLALDPDLERSTGGYYSYYIRWPLPPWATNKKMTDWLWRESEKLVGISSGERIQTIDV